MKKISIILFMVLSYSAIFGQVLSDSKLEIVDKKSINFEKTISIIESKKFHFSAQWKQRGLGIRQPVLNAQNYIIMNDTTVRGQLQYPSFRSLSEPEDGNFIFDGKVSKYEIVANDDKETINVSYFLKFRYNIYKVEMNVNASGNAIVTLAPRDNRVTMTYYGVIE